MNYWNEPIKQRNKTKHCSAAVKLMNLPYLSTTVPPFHTPVTFCLRTSCWTRYSLLPWCHQLSLGHLWLYGTLLIFSAEQEAGVDSTSWKHTDLHHHLYGLPLFLISSAFQLREAPMWAYLLCLGTSLYDICWNKVNLSTIFSTKLGWNLPNNSTGWRKQTWIDIKSDQLL